MAKKILLIEDEQIMFDLLQKKLSGEGYEVSIAKDGEEGLRAERSKTRPYFTGYCHAQNWRI